MELKRPKRTKQKPIKKLEATVKCICRLVIYKDDVATAKQPRRSQFSLSMCTNYAINIRARAKQDPSKIHPRKRKQGQGTSKDASDVVTLSRTLLPEKHAQARKRQDEQDNQGPAHTSDLSQVQADLEHLTCANLFGPRTPKTQSSQMQSNSQASTFLPGTLRAG
eukprot:2140489-Amphidinium_carterae.1